MTLHERIKSVRTEHNLSQDVFATSIGLKRANYAQIELGKQNPTLETITEIVRNYNKTYDYLIDGSEKIAPNIAPIVAPNEQKGAISMMPKVVAVEKESKRELVSLVPVKAAAGYLNGYGDTEYVESLPTIELPGTNGQTHRGFEIRGKSMLPTHHPGSIAIGSFVESFNDIRDRRVYIVVTKQDGIVLKRVLNRIKKDGKLVLLSDNDDKREYPNYPVYPEEVLELWYWRMSIIRESPEPGTVYSRLNDLDGRLASIENIIRQNKSQLQGG